MPRLPLGGEGDPSQFVEHVARWRCSLRLETHMRHFYGAAFMHSLSLICESLIRLLSRDDIGLISLGCPAAFLGHSFASGRIRRSNSAIEFPPRLSPRETSC